MWFWLFVVSCSLNLLAIFYIRWLIKTVAAINQDVENLSNLIAQFSAHLGSVHELEMFYGDDTLKSLMAHASELSEKLFNIDLILNEKETDAETEEETSQEN